MTDASSDPALPAALRISVVVPVRNEAGNIAPLVEEIARALAAHGPFEIIFVNDGSTDATEAELRGLMNGRTFLRQLKHAVACGQSAAVHSGVAAARGAIVVTLDEVKRAMRLVAEKSRVIAEGAGALAVAAAVSGKAGEGPIVAVISGGNVDLKKFAELVLGA